MYLTLPNSQTLSSLKTSPILILKINSFLISTSPEISRTRPENKREVNKMLKLGHNRRVIRKRKASEITKIMITTVTTEEDFSSQSYKTYRDF